MNSYSLLFQFPHHVLLPCRKQDEPKEIRGETLKVTIKTKSGHVSVRSANSPVSPLMLQGGREVGDFISYLKREASNPLVVQEESKKKKKKKDDDDKIEL